MSAPLVPVDRQHPQPRTVEHAVEALRDGGLLCYPSDTTDALGCDAHQRRAVERLAQLKRRDPRKPFALLVPDLSDLARYAQVSNFAYRVVRQLAPGPFTFVLPATKLVPDLVLRRQKTVGIRLPDSPIALALVHKLAHPVISTSAATPGGEVLIDARDIKEQLGHGLDLILDGGYQANEPSSVIDLTGPEPVVVRQGKGDCSDLAL